MTDADRNEVTLVLKFAKRLFTWWHDQTLGTQLFTWWRGFEVGEDTQGNRYFRDREDHRRWVIYAGEIEGSRVSPEWHGWLHHTWDKPPTERALLRKPWEQEHLANLTGTAEAHAPSGSIRGATSPAQHRGYESWRPVE